MRNHVLETTNHKLGTSQSKNRNSNTIVETVETTHPQIVRTVHKHTRDKKTRPINLPLTTNSLLEYNYKHFLH